MRPMLYPKIPDAFCIQLNTNGKSMNRREQPKTVAWHFMPTPYQEGMVVPAARSKGPESTLFDLIVIHTDESLYLLSKFSIKCGDVSACDPLKSSRSSRM